LPPFICTNKSLLSQIRKVRKAASMDVNWSRIMFYYNSKMFVQQMFAFDAFCRLVITPIHDKFGGVSSGRVNKVDGELELQELPPGFNAPTMGEACRCYLLLSAACLTCLCACVLAVCCVLLIVCV
jgi:hypothetical protein